LLSTVFGYVLLLLFSKKWLAKKLLE
jgi:uncharacterized membrane protein (DUF485 family)